MVELATVAGGTQSELWSALDGQLKAGLDVLVTIPIDTGLGVDAGPPVEGVELATQDRDGHHPSRRRSIAEVPAPWPGIRHRAACGPSC